MAIVLLYKIKIEIQLYKSFQLQIHPQKPYETNQLQLYMQLFGFAN
jgi:hypothetical protein